MRSWMFVLCLGCGAAQRPALHPATGDDLVGSWTEEVAIQMLSYALAPECRRDGGRWVEGDGCWFDGANTVNVTPVGEVSVEIVTTNAHMCSFEGKLTAVDGGWTAAPVEGGACELRFKVQGRLLEVSNNGECADFCGARAFLAIQAAHR